MFSSSMKDDIKAIKGGNRPNDSTKDTVLEGENSEKKTVSSGIDMKNEEISSNLKAEIKAVLKDEDKVVDTVKPDFNSAVKKDEQVVNMQGSESRDDEKQDIEKKSTSKDMLDSLKDNTDKEGFKFKMEDENSVGKENGVDPKINQELKEVVAKKEEDEKKTQSEDSGDSSGIKKINQGSKIKIFAGVFFVLVLTVLVSYFFIFSEKDSSQDEEQTIEEEVVEEYVFEEKNSEPEFMQEGENEEEEEVAEMNPEELSLENDEERLMNLTYLAEALMDYCFEQEIDFPISENYSKLNEENSISDFMSVIPQKEGEEFSLFDPRDPDFYYGYKSIDGRSFEFTAHMENQEQYECKTDILENTGACIFGIHMDEEFISKVKGIGEVAE